MQKFLFSSLDFTDEHAISKHFVHCKVGNFIKTQCSYCFCSEMLQSALTAVFCRATICWRSRPTPNFWASMQVSVRCTLRDRYPVCCSSVTLVLWPNGLVYQDATRYGGRPRLGDIAPTERGTEAPFPTFQPTAIVAKRLLISATAELLLYSHLRSTQNRTVPYNISVQKMSGKIEDIIG